MRRLVWLAIGVMFLGGCGGPGDVGREQESRESRASESESSAATESRRGRIGEMVTPEIPLEAWEPIYFREIDRTATDAGEGPLRTKRLDESEIEMRIWGGFGLIPLEGFTLNRTGNRWEAKSIAADRKRNNEPTAVSLAEPENGWDMAWGELLGLQILNLPDAASIKCNPGRPDGFSYVVEVKKGDRYRTYMYENPAAKHCPEADQMLMIARFVETEYGISWNPR